MDIVVFEDYGLEGSKLEKKEGHTIRPTLGTQEFDVPLSGSSALPFPTWSTTHRFQVQLFTLTAAIVACIPKAHWAESPPKGEQ